MPRPMMGSVVSSIVGTFCGLHFPLHVPLLFILAWTCILFVLLLFRHPLSCILLHVGLILLTGLWAQLHVTNVSSRELGILINRPREYVELVGMINLSPTVKERGELERFTIEVSRCSTKKTSRLRRREKPLRTLV
ncbi:MAG: DUF4131 domain-containing protein [Kiritimatiellae bacterium]|nr:DUF4131 domain-containing protein [Kiritimatiellia bacterium]